MKRVLITGAAGYVGSALARLLIQRCFDVTLMDNFSNPSNITRVEGVEIEKADIRDTHLDVSEFDYIIHCAAISGIKQCEEKRDEAKDVNIKGVFNLLRTCRGRFILPSSSAVYGQAITPDIDEIHPTQPRNYYGKTKLEAEWLVNHYNNFCVLRFSNIYGRALTTKRTVADLFVEQAIKGEPITIHGDGRQRRDFVHISDVLVAYWKAMHFEDNDTFNIGGNEALSVNDIAELVIKNHRQLFGMTPKVSYVSEGCGVEWRDFTYSSKKAKDMLGYEPTWSVSDEIRDRIKAHASFLCNKGEHSC